MQESGVTRGPIIINHCFYCRRTAAFTTIELEEPPVANKISTNFKISLEGDFQGRVVVDFVKNAFLLKKDISRLLFSPYNATPSRCPAAGHVFFQILRVRQANVIYLKIYKHIRRVSLSRPFYTSLISLQNNHRLISLYLIDV